MTKDKITAYTILRDCRDDRSGMAFKAGAQVAAAQFEKLFAASVIANWIAIGVVQPVTDGEEVTNGESGQE